MAIVSRAGIGDLPHRGLLLLTNARENDTGDPHAYALHN